MRWSILFGMFITVLMLARDSSKVVGRSWMAFTVGTDFFLTVTANEVDAVLAGLGE